MRVALAFLWITLMVAPLVAEKNPHLALSGAGKMQQHADASVSGAKSGAGQAATAGKHP